MKLSLITVLCALSAAVSPAAAQTRASQYRPGIKVEQIFRQKIEYFHTDWFGRLEKKNGAWRDVYFEADGKFVNKGVISFNCADSKADIGLILYGTDDYGEAASRQVVRVRLADRKAWADRSFELLTGETPSYQFFLTARARYCKK